MLASVPASKAIAVRISGSAEGAHGPRAQIEKMTQGERIISRVLREQGGYIHAGGRGLGAYSQVRGDQAASRSQQKENDGDAASSDAERVAGRAFLFSAQPAADHQGEGRQRGQRIVFLARREAEEDHHDCGPYGQQFPGLIVSGPGRSALNTKAIHGISQTASKPQKSSSGTVS